MMPDVNSVTKLGAVALVVCLFVDRPMLAQAPPGYVDASSFGFNPIDATAALQAAIDTGSNVYVPNMASDWIVTPITLSHSNQEILFQSGVVIAAKPGSFLGVEDALFSAASQSNVKLTGYGATFKMRKSDYQQAPYPTGEWRHGINLRDVSGVEIQGLTIQDTGGDGVYLGSNTQTGFNSNVVIKDVVLNNNYRQGISVISVQNLLVDNAMILNTNGTAPEAGIDFEVNFQTQRIMGVQVRNSIMQANDSYGILFAGYSTLQDGPITVDIENVTILSNKADGIRLYDPLPGVTIKDSLIVGNMGAGLRGAQGTFALPRNSIEYSALRSNGLGSLAGWTQLGTGSFTNVTPMFYSLDPASPYFLFLQPSNPLSILQGAQDGGYMGARPKYVAGDYNANGEVDAADYVVWRKNPDGFGGDPAGYNTWRTNFGQPSGSAATVGTSEAVPEPCGLLLVVSGVGVLVLLRSDRRSQLPDRQWFICVRVLHEIAR